MTKITVRGWFSPPALKLTGVLYALCAALLLGLMAAPASSRAATPANWQKSVTLQPRWSEDFAGAASDASIDQARRANANSLTLIIPFQQDNVGATNIYRAGHAPSDAALKHAIDKAHALGMQVTLKPHLDPNDGQWRAFINPADRNTWFNSYGNLLNYYATLAQQNRVEQLVVGSELITMATSTSNADNTARWRTLIAQVRQRFSGKLTYSANWGGNYFAEEFPHIAFWDALDYIGISAYFGLSNYNNPSVSQLLDSWNYWNTNKIQPFQQSVGKPVLFTEVGYRSVDGAAINPWDWGAGGNYNPQEQVNGIDALLQYWNNYPWFSGLHYWTWKTDPNCCGAGDTNYEVQNKPGYDTMRLGYAASGPGNPPPATLSFSLVSAGVTPSTASPGATLAISAALKASAAGSVLVDMEVYNSAGTKVHQQYASTQSFTAGQTRTYTWNWTTPANQAAGDYTVSIGVFTDDWTKNYLWSSNAASFVLSSTAPPPAPTPTPTLAPPTATPVAPGPTVTPPPATPTPTASPTPVPGGSQYVVEIWWPTNGVRVNGVQPFKARIYNLDLSQYNMYWQVDGDQLNLMANNTTDGPHKESVVNLSGWTWRGSGPYTLNFVAKDLSGRLLGQKAVQIYVQ